MSRISDYKIVGEGVLMGLAMAGGCACRGALDTCSYCALVRAQEALERLVAGDPFVPGVDGVDGVAEEGEWVWVIE
jgi:hypothetical protein